MPGSLWGIPDGVQELDDAALMGGEGILSRLSLAPPDSTSQSVGVGRDPGNTIRNGRRERAVSARASTSDARRRSGSRAAALGPAHVALVVLAFAAAVLGGLLFGPSSRGGGQLPPGGSGMPKGQIITSGPSDCPMYVVPLGAGHAAPVPPAGGCFYVG
jgi:hypothetical protein